MSDATSQHQSVVLFGYNFDTGALEEHRFTGHLLGQGTTHRQEHLDLIHDVNSFAAPGERCPACRWFEVRIYAVDAGADDDDESGGYYVETVGRSTVPGEVDRRRVRRVFEPRRIVATLVQSKDGRVFVPLPSRGALEQAADRDPRIAEVIDDLLVL